MDRLTALRVSKVSAPGRYSDGDGLYLQISKWHTKSWVFRFERQQRERWMGLGPISVLTLAEAREKVRECHKLLLDGIDPIEARKTKRMTARVETARGITFRECAERYVASLEASWKNDKHKAQWRATLETYAYPVIGGLAIADIDTGLVLKVLEPIWGVKPETASRVQQRIRRIIDWAKARGYRAGDNPAAWAGHLDKLLPPRRKVRGVNHHPALPYSEIPSFMAELRAREGISARALEITALTALRTGEVIGAEWSEFDTRAQLWTVPAERMKGAREHRVPLSDRALEILSMLPRENGNGHVFIGARAGSSLSNMAMLELMRGMQPGYVPHGLRSTFRDWAAETTSYPNHVVEMALAHVVGDKVEAASIAVADTVLQ
jgi:integrase